MTRNLFLNRFVFAPTKVLFGALFIIGVVQSYRSESRPPGVSLDYNWYLDKLYAEKNYDEYVRELEVALLYEAVDEVQAHRTLGQLSRQGGDPIAAIEHFKTALAAMPDDSEALQAIAESLLQLNRYKEAIPYLQKTVRAQPNLDGVRFNLGWSLAQTGQFDAAIDEFQELVRRQPKEARYHDTLGLILAQAGRLDAAIQEFRKALAIEPVDVNYRSHLSAAETARGR